MSLRRVVFLAVVSTVAVAPLWAGGGQRGDWELGIYAGLGAPDDYASTTSVTAFDPDQGLLWGGRVGYWFTPHWSLETSFQQLSTESPALGGLDVELTSVRLNALVNFRPERRLRPFLTFGVGTERTDIELVMDESNAGINAGAGLRAFFGRSFGIRTELRVASVDPGAPIDGRQTNVEATFGLLWAFGGSPPRDSDFDGVPDKLDLCPRTRPGALVDEDGCPIDSDGDGVPDGIDECPGTPPGYAVDERGCRLDSDGDGVNDALDRCPGTPAGAVVNDAGCPLDSDGDTVPDGIDQCPDTPRGALVDAVGCPIDSDGDGVPDGVDRCPGTPPGAVVDALGCPIDSDGDGVPDGIDRCPGTRAGVEVDEFGCEILFEEGRAILVLEGVHFAVDSDELTVDSKTILDGVAASLREWSEVRVEIGGHTDSTGDATYNFRLSERRAASVRAHLVSAGVDGSRLVARGYGENRPIADNATAGGRSKNRRVELKKLE